MEKEQILSPSKLKTLEECSWRYYCQYVLKLPQKNNDGALRGTTVHDIFEILMNPRHKKHYDTLIATNSVEGCLPVKKLLIKYLKHHGIFTIKNYDLCNAMILVGLKNDFFGLGGKQGAPEFKFTIENEKPKYKIRGIIDKYCFYDNKKLKISDFKSSKQKFSKDELEGNIQGMTYSLAGYKILGASDVDAEFIFLRFPKAPIQPFRATINQLKGFEEYLAYSYTLVNNFTKKIAESNLAANNDDHRWLCGRIGNAFVCPFRDSFTYYALKNPDGSVVKTSFKNDLKPSLEQTVVILKSPACPAWKNRKPPKQLEVDDW